MQNHMTHHSGVVSRTSLGFSEGLLSPFLLPRFPRPLCPRVLEVLVSFQFISHNFFYSELKETDLRFSHRFSGQMRCDLFKRRWVGQMTEWEIPEERGVGPDSRTSPRSTHDSSSVQNHCRVLIAQEQLFPVRVVLSFWRGPAWVQILASHLLCDPACYWTCLMLFVYKTGIMISTL